MLRRASKLNGFCAVFCENGNELSGSIKGGELLDLVTDC
jgi:hypothetical protein